jgi:uncharacterized protein YjiS (DUF1127 family)
MSSTDFASSAPVSRPSASQRGWLTGLALGAIRWALHAQQQHRDRTRIHNMDAHLLKDIGLHRDQIDDLLRGSATQRWRSTRRAVYRPAC